MAERLREASWFAQQNMQVPSPAPNSTLRAFMVLRAVFVCEGNISDRLWIKAYCMRKKPVKKRIIVLSMATALFLGIVFVFF